MRKGSLSSTSSLAIVICCLFDNNLSDRCELIISVLLICIPLTISDVECLFLCLLAICMVYVCVFDAGLYERFCIFWILFPYQLLCLQLFSSILSVVFSSCCLWFTLTSLVAQRVKCLPAMLEIWVRSLGWENPLEKEMAAHSSILAWKIPWTEKPGRLQSMGSQRVGHN